MVAAITALVLNTAPEEVDVIGGAVKIAGSEVPVPQKVAGTFPTTMVKRLLSHLPDSPSSPERTYCPGVKPAGTFQVQLPVFGILSIRQ